MPDIKCFERARADPFYAEKVAPDEQKFFSWDGTRWMLGYERVYIKDGQMVDWDQGDTKSS
jgi:hypothetical protein